MSVDLFFQFIITNLDMKCLFDGRQGAYQVKRPTQPGTSKFVKGDIKRDLVLFYTEFISNDPM